jgi:hypothetical protein
MNGQKSDSCEVTKRRGRPATNLDRKDYRPLVRAIWGRRGIKDNLTQLCSALAATAKAPVLTGAVPSADAIKKMISGTNPMNPVVLDLMHDHFGFRAWGLDRDGTWKDTESIKAALDRMDDGLHVLLSNWRDKTGARLSLTHDGAEAGIENSAALKAKLQKEGPKLQQAGPQRYRGLMLRADGWHLFKLGGSLKGGSVVVLEFGWKSRKFWSLMDRSDVATLNGNAIDQVVRLRNTGSATLRVHLLDASVTETCEIFVLWFRAGVPEAIVDKLPRSAPGMPTAEVEGLCLCGALKGLESADDRPLVTSLVYTPY